MARPRSVTDEAILDAAMGVMTRYGPAALTFAALAAGVGLSAATLVQRFPNKEALLQATLQRAWDELDRLTAEQDATQPQSFEGAIAMLQALWPVGGDVDDYANGLLILREDMRDPLLRARGVAWLDALALGLGRRIAPASEARRFGRLMTSQWQGAQIWWAFNRNGAPNEALAEELRHWRAALKLP